MESISGFSRRLSSFHHQFSLGQPQNGSRPLNPSNTQFDVLGVITLSSFAAPDVYLLTTGKNLPWTAYLVVISVMMIGGAVSLIKMRLNARDLRLSHG